MPGFVFVILISVYLVFLVDAYALNTAMERLFVFAFFVAVCVFLAYLKRRFLGKIRLSLSFNTQVLSAFIAALLLTGFYSVLLPQEREAAISLEAVAWDGKEAWGEVWLTEVKANGVEVPMSSIQVSENSGWIYIDEYSSYVFYPSENNEGNHLTMHFKAKTLSFCFGYNTWSGKVQITDPFGGYKRYNLHADGNGKRDFDYPMPQTPYALIAAGGCYLILFLVINLLFSLTGLLDPQKVNQQYVSAFFTTIVFLLLYFTSDKIAPDLITMMILIVLTTVAYRTILTEKAGHLLKRYRTRGKMLAVATISLYASVVSFGQRFFLDGNIRIHFPAKGFFYLLLGTAWFIPVIYFMLFGLELLASFPKRRNGVRKVAADRRRAFAVLLGSLCVCQAVILWAFWPGAFPADCITQLKHMLGIWPLSDYHPVLNILFYRVILTVIPNLGAIPAVQMFFFALLCTKFLMIGYDYGIPLKILAGLGIVFILLPNQALSGICPVKDYPYMLSLLWGTYLLIRLNLNPEKIRKACFLVALAVDFFFICVFRHNGIVPFMALILLFLMVTIRHFLKVRLHLLAVSGASILLIMLYKGPLFSALDVRANDLPPYITMLCAVGSCVNKDLPLSEEANSILESVISLEDWGDYYGRYLGYDLYFWGRENAETEFIPNKLSIREAFFIYFEALLKYPDVVLKDRLDGMDIMWDVRQPDDSFNVRAFDGIYVEDTFAPYLNLDSFEGSYYINPSPLANLYRKALVIPCNNISDILLWRTGVYLILAMVLGLFWWGNRMKNLLWAAVPLLGNIAGLVLILCHQSFRYVYTIQVLVVVLVFCSICLRDQEREIILRWNRLCNENLWNLLDWVIEGIGYREILHAVSLKKEDTVCDIGCRADGKFLYSIMGQIARGYGLDMKTANYTAGNLEFKQVEDLNRGIPLPDASVDYVFLNAVLERLSDPAQLIVEIARILKPGGKLVLTTPTPFGKPILELLAFRLHVISEAKILDHKHYYTKKEIIRFCRSCGFDDSNTYQKFCFGLNSISCARKKGTCASEDAEKPSSTETENKKIEV